MQTVILHSTALNIAEQIAREVGGEIEMHAAHCRIHSQQIIDVAARRAQFQVDINPLPAFDFANATLFVSDMDSTLITIECIDEIADFADLKPQVSAITERAMQGELDFNASLLARVKLLAGVLVSVLDAVYSQRLKLSLGAVKLLDFLRARQIKTAVVSGGFDYFTNKLAAQLNLDAALANSLEIENNQLTGRVAGTIINAQAKADFVRQLCERYQTTPAQTLVAGDGANDLAMMALAGLSVAYHAKPVVAACADVVINWGGLDLIMDFFGENYVG